MFLTKDTRLDGAPYGQCAGWKFYVSVLRLIWIVLQVGSQAGVDRAWVSHSVLILV